MRSLAALAFVVLGIGTLPYFEGRWVADESWYSLPAVSLVKTGVLRNPAMPDYDPESHIDTKPILMTLSLAGAFRALGTSVAAARCGVLAAAVLALAVVYRLGTKLGGPFAGAAAAMFFASDNFTVLAARTARPEAWVMLLSTVAIFLARRCRSDRHAAFAGACAAMACLFHALAIASIAASAALILAAAPDRRLRARWLIVFAATAAVFLLPFVVWLLISPDRIEAARQMFGREPNSTLPFVQKEWLRYADFLGVPNVRVGFPVRVPLRLHIALAILASFVILWRRNRTAFVTLTLSVLPYLLWMLRLPNPSARYFAAVAPMFALAVGAAIATLTGTRIFRPAVVMFVLCVATQLAGTAVFLNQARHADYQVLSERLRGVLPEGRSCFASMTLQFAVVDRNCHSYERTPFSYTATVQRPEYLVLGDRVMMQGSGLGQDSFGDVRREAFAFAERHGQVTARIDDPFYGNLVVYRVSYDATADRKRER